jgi:ATP-binding cassette subfamily B protein
MDEFSRYAEKPWSFCARFIARRPYAHAAILVAVVAAVACSVSTQYGVKALVDALTDSSKPGAAWSALGLLAGLIAADNLLWRVASYVGSFAFVGVTGDVRRELFQHLTGHSPSFFADKQPGTLASRVTATANAFFTVENMFVWNVLPPCVAAFGAILFIGSVSWLMALGLAVIFFGVIVLMFKMAAAGRPLHHDFANKAASVDGEIVDLVGNMSIVKSFGGLPHEITRFGGTLEREMAARRKSLLYLERLRLTHAIITIAVTLGLLIWAVSLWSAGKATPGQVVLVCTLGLSILHATRDLAVALVDVTQHTARLAEALSTILTPHHLRDHADAATFAPQRARIVFENVSFGYPDTGQPVFRDFNLQIEAGEWIGLIGESGAGKSTLFALLQRFYDIRGGRILIDDQDIALVTQDSLRQAITVVPQDVFLFHRTLRENIRYGRPDATDEEIMDAAGAARCTDFIKALPQGLDTIVGDRGVKLSGGQRQRIAIARALLKNAPILLLDEATSALDNRSEAEVREALATLMQGRTVIAIAHRLTTLNGFDRIVTLENGHIIRDTIPERALAGVTPERARVRSFERRGFARRTRASF